MPEYNLGKTAVMLFCRESVRTRKLSPVVHPRGLLVWCRECRASHLLTWEEVDAVKRMVAFPAHLR